MHSSGLGRAFDQLPEAARRRGPLLGGFAMGIAGALAAGTVLGSLLARRSRRAAAERRVDGAGEDSFPASDAPLFAATRKEQR